MRKLLYGLLLATATTVFVYNNDGKDQNLEKYVEWGLDCDCAGGHSDGKVINGLTKAEDCHYGYFDHYYKSTIYLHQDSLPTIKHFKYLLKGSKNPNFKLINLTY